MQRSSLETGTVIAGRYELVRPMKEGGMGAVYEVIDRQTNRRRALKVLHVSAASDAGTRERFKLEATVSGRVESDHVVEVVDAGYDDDLDFDFLVMELLRGEDLGSVLSDRGALSPVDVVTLLGQAALGLDKVHAEGVVHRDLKLENVFLHRRDDGGTTVKLLDFGVAKVFEGGSGPLQTTQAVGTPLYMAPEQLTGDAYMDGRADLYALGHLAYTLLVGTAYWQLEFEQVKNLYPFMLKVVQGASEAPSERAARDKIRLPRAFDDWFGRATAKDPDQRFESARRQVLELSGALGVEPPTMLLQADTPVSIPSEPPAVTEASATGVAATQRVVPPTRRRALAGIVAAIATVTGALVGWRFMPGPRAGAAAPAGAESADTVQVQPRGDAAAPSGSAAASSATPPSDDRPAAASASVSASASAAPPPPKPAIQRPPAVKQPDVKPKDKSEYDPLDEL